MSRRLPLNLKWLALGSLGLPLAMVLLRLLWPDVSWGFLFLFGLQVVLVLATLQLVLTSIWGPASRWELPIKATRLPRLIFAKKSSFMPSLRGMGQRVKVWVAAPVGRLFKRKAP